MIKLIHKNDFKFKEKKSGSNKDKQSTAMNIEPAI